MTALSTPRRHPRPDRALPARPACGPAWRTSGLAWLVAGELAAGAFGFLALAYQARRLGPDSFGRVEYAAAVAAWLLVLVRGGVDVIVYREAARRPRLVRPLTDLLVAIRLLAAVAAVALACGLALAVGPGRAPLIVAAALSLFAAAWATDVGPRSAGRLACVALGQGARTLGLVAAALLLVRGPGDALAAALCLVVAELSGAAVLLVDHARRHGFPRPRWRRRASTLLLKRGLVTGLARFARVSLYAADVLALGWWAGDEFGAYAGARRLVFALIGLGLAVPSALAPMVARAWAEGQPEASRRVAMILCGLWSASLPAAVGLTLTAGRWMPAVFGAAYLGGGPLLALVAARLPWVLAAGASQAALVACRRERAALRVILWQVAVAAVVIPPAAYLGGPRAVGWGAMAVEVVGALAGWSALRSMGVAPGWAPQVAAPLAGCLGLVAGFRAASGMPLGVTTLAGVVGYALAWRFGRRVLDSTAPHREQFS